MAKKKKNIPPPIKQQAEQKKAPVATPQPKVAVATAAPTYRPRVQEAKTMNFIFGRLNYILMIAGLLLLALGFILMIGGGSEDPKVFNPALFDTQRLTISTLLILLGFAFEVVAILKKPKTESGQAKN